MCAWKLSGHTPLQKRGADRLVRQVCIGVFTPQHHHVTVLHQLMLSQPMHDVRHVAYASELNDAALRPQRSTYDGTVGLCDLAPTHQLVHLEQGIGATLDECHAAGGWRLSKEEPDNSAGRMPDGQQCPCATNGIPPLLRLVQKERLVIQGCPWDGMSMHAYDFNEQPGHPADARHARQSNTHHCCAT